jgi:hypothetical protein
MAVMRVTKQPSEKIPTAKRESTLHAIPIQSAGVCVGDDQQLLLEDDERRASDNDQVNMALELRIPGVGPSFTIRL